MTIMLDTVEWAIEKYKKLFFSTAGYLLYVPLVHLQPEKLLALFVVVVLVVVNPKPLSVSVYKTASELLLTPNSFWKFVLIFILFLIASIHSKITSIRKIAYLQTEDG